MAKLFCFTFCNSYGGFVYLAFIGEPVVGVACEKSCMSLLATNLTIVFVVQLLVRKGNKGSPHVCTNPGRKRYVPLKTQHVAVIFAITWGVRLAGRGVGCALL